MPGGFGKASVTSLSTKPKRVRKSELEKEAARLEREAEARQAAGADTATAAPAPVPTLSDAEVIEAVIRAQWEHPEYGLKRVVKHLREIRGLTISEARTKKFLVFPCHPHGAVCVVGEVFPDSPAAKAGLLSGDVVVDIAGQTGKSYVSVSDTIVPIISKGEGQALNATVLRRPGVDPTGRAGELKLKLTPQKWSAIAKGGRLNSVSIKTVWSRSGMVDLSSYQRGLEFCESCDVWTIFQVNRVASAMSANGRAVVGGDDAASDSLESESMVVVLLSAVFPQIPADGVKELLDAIAVGIDVLRRCDAALRCPLAADLVQAVMQGDTSRARSIIYSQCSRTKAIQDAEAALERRRPPRNDRPPRASRSDRRPHKRVIYTRTPEVSTSEGDEPGLGTSQGSSDSVASSPKPRGNGSGWSRSWQIPSTGPSFPSGSSRTRRYSAERQPLTTHEVPSTRRRPAEKPRPVSFWVPLGSEPASSDRHGRQRTLPSDSALCGHPLDPRETDERRPRGLRSSPSRGRTTGYGIEYTPRPQRQPSQHEAVQPQSPAVWATSVHASTSPHASASTANGMSARRTRGGEPRPSAPADAYAHIYDRDVGPISASYPTEPRLQRDTSQSGWTELNASPFRP